MHILGVNDGPDAGAALVVGDQVVALASQQQLDGRLRSRAFPWEAIEAVLEEGGLSASDVDIVAVAGRITPPFFLRRHPRLRAVARGAFSPALDLGVFFQAMLRQSGVAAMEADRASDWLLDRFRERGFRPQRIVLVDIHRALAEAAYRHQPLDDLFVISLHPMGDGVAMAVHRGRSGQLDRLFEQKGFAALHLHLQRCAAAIGLDFLIHDAVLWGLAGRANPDPELVGLLDRELRAEGPRLSRRSYPIPARAEDALYRRLRAAEPEVAAASILRNLVGTVCDLVRHHLAPGGRRLALCGAVFDNPRLCAEVAALDEVEHVWVPPAPGHAALALGAASMAAGLHPRAMPTPGLGRTLEPSACRAALQTAGDALVEATPEAVAERLARGEAVGRFVGRGGFGRSGLGACSVLVRADRVDEVRRAAQALGRHEAEEPAAAVLEAHVEGVAHRERLGRSTRFGTVAPRVDADFARRYPAVITPDGRVHLIEVGPSDPELHAVLLALDRRTGCGAVAVLPLARGGQPRPATPERAAGIAAEAHLDALELGPWLRDLRRVDQEGRDSL